MCNKNNLQNRVSGKLRFRDTKLNIINRKIEDEERTLIECDLEYQMFKHILSNYKNGLIKISELYGDVDVSDALNKEINLNEERRDISFLKLDFLKSERKNYYDRLHKERMDEIIKEGFKVKGFFPKEIHTEPKKEK